MKRLVIVLIVVAVVAGGAYVAYTMGYLPANIVPATASSANEDVAAPGNQAGKVDENESAIEEPIAMARVLADAKVVPIQSANLSMSAGGIVQRLTAKEGDLVRENDLLVELDDAQAQVAVAQAQANLQRAQANLAQLESGARTQEIANAEAALDAATANYERQATASMPGNIASAQAVLAQSQANLAQVLEGPSDEALIGAKADIESAKAQLSQATSAYNRVKSRNDIGMLPESLNLQQATIAYEAAQARYDDLLSGATPAQIAGASAGVSQSRAQLDTLRNSMPLELLAAQATVEQAQAQLDLLKAGSRPEAIAIAKADVAAATASLQQALVSLGDTELRAPFDGIMATVNKAEGEQVSPGEPVVVIADNTAWEIETSDLTEFDIVGITQGRPVVLTFDAIPDLEMSGTVVRIRPIGEDNRGDTVYKVVVVPDKDDPRLLWNMTAVVDFGDK